MNQTHDPSIRSWVESANDPRTDFPIQNLPFGIFSDDDNKSPRVGVAIGDYVLDVAVCVADGLLPASDGATACDSAMLNNLMSVSPRSVSMLRADLSDLLRIDSVQSSKASAAGDRILCKTSDVLMHLPAEIGDYTDFYASVSHATNVGRMFRPDNPLLPNYKHVPIGYHGRASSIVASGSGVRRPSGQTKAADAEFPSFGPSRMLDYESELGFYVANGNEIGEVIPIERAADHIFGFSLVNDWSARDIQAWEYQPLGPFLAKNFGTTVSPWVVTSEAVEPYRVPAAARPPEDPSPLAYLSSTADAERGGLSAILEVFLSTLRMQQQGIDPVKLSSASFEGMYWTVSQMLAHHASNGCNLRAGDLLASGTVSGDSEDSRGCLLELTWRGAKPIQLPGGEQRKFLEDGDRVIMKGYLEATGRPRIGFGECVGTILSAG